MKEAISEKKTARSLRANKRKDAAIRDSIQRVLDYNGYSIGVEFGIGDIRFKGTDHEKVMQCLYGHFRGDSEGKYIGLDGDSVDCYIGSSTDSQLIFRIAQQDENGELDEYKYMLWFTSLDDAKAMYLAHMPESFFQSIDEVKLDEIEDAKQCITDSVNFDIKIVDCPSNALSKAITDGVVSTIEMTRAGVVNSNKRGYKIPSTKRVIEELNTRISIGIASQSFDDHSTELMDKTGELRGYADDENPKVGDLIETWFDDETNIAYGRLLWNELTPEGAQLAKDAQDKTKAKNIKFSIKAKKDTCETIDGVNWCDLEAIYGVDRVKKPADTHAGIINTKVIKDSIQDVPAQPCGPQCSRIGCHEARITIEGEIKMPFNAERVKQLHATTPPISYESAQNILLNESTWEWKSVSDWEAIKAYWESLGTETKADTTDPLASVTPKADDAKTDTVYTAPPATDAAGPAAKTEDGVSKEPFPVKPGSKKNIQLSADGEKRDKEELEDMAAISDEALKKMMDKGMSWDDAKDLLGSLGHDEMAITAAGERWMAMEKEKKPEPDVAMEDKKIQDKTITDNKKENDTVANQSTPVDPARVARDKELDSIIAERAALAAEQAFTDSVNTKLEATSLSKEAKAELKKKLAEKFKKYPASADSITDAFIEDAVANASNFNKLAELRRSMGYTTDTGIASGSQVITDAQENVEKAFYDKVDKAAEQAILDGVLDVPNRRLAVAQRQEQKKLMGESPFFQSILNAHRSLGENNKKIVDSISNSDIHGISTVLNRETVLEQMIIMETFFQPSITNVCMALAPGSFQQRFPMGGTGRGVMGGAAKASPIALGGVYVMGLEKVTEDEAALEKNYHIARNAGRIPYVNTGFEHNTFATHTRMAGIVMDLESAQQMASGPFNYQIAVRAALQRGAALGRSIDTELGEDMVFTSREFGAVHAATETPAGDGSTTGEWLYAGGGSAGGYGSTVKAVASLLGPYSTTTLKTSTENGDYYPAPLVKNRVRTYVDGLTGITTDYTPYAITVTFADATVAVEGYLNSANQIAALNEGEVPNWAPDLMNARIVSTGPGTVSAAVKFTVRYWYATNYIIWSKTKGRWSGVGAVFDSDIVSGDKLPIRARAYIDEITAVGGDLTQERQKYPDFALAQFNYVTGYVCKAESFQQQNSPVDTTLMANYGPSQIGCTDGGIIHLKTSNGRWHHSKKTITGMGIAQSVLIGQAGSTFYGLGYVYPDNSLDRVRYAPSGGGLTEAVNAMSSQSGFIDTVGTPIYGDGRNFSYIEVIIVD